MALPASGLYPIAILALIVASYGSATLARASGFLAVYVSALVLGNARLPHGPAIRGFAEGVACLAQIGLFVMLGLLASPARLPAQILPAIAAGAVVMLVARPAAVAAATLPLRVPWRQQAFMSWAGLRGAVPIVLATIPMNARVSGSTRLFDIVFIIVVLNTLAQGPTLPWAARRLKVTAPAEPLDVDVEGGPVGGAARRPAAGPDPARVTAAGSGDLRAAAARPGQHRPYRPPRARLRPHPHHPAADR